MDSWFILINKQGDKKVILPKKVWEECATLTELYDKGINCKYICETDEMFTNVINILYYNQAINNLDPASVLSQLQIKPNKVEVKFALKIGSFTAQIFWTEMIKRDDTLAKVEKHKYSFMYLDEFHREKNIDVGEEDIFYPIENTGDIEEISISQAGVVTMRRK